MKNSATATTILVLASIFAGAVGGYGLAKSESSGLSSSFSTATGEHVQTSFEGLLKDNNAAEYNVSVHYHTTGDVYYTSPGDIVEIAMMQGGEMALAQKTTVDMIQHPKVVSGLKDQINQKFRNEGINVQIDNITATGEMKLPAPKDKQVCDMLMERIIPGDKTGAGAQICQSAQANNGIAKVSVF
ncbi:MAG: hypothetical protein GC185_00190 [Alphaproteobacteria bacterium]|nr:hypothetical protein [Alphaproteobacteria bacterium]